MEKAARIGKPLSCGRVRFLMAAFAAVMMALIMFWGSRTTVHAAGGLSLSTEYPGVTITPGETLNITLTLTNTSGSPVNADVAIASLPDGWEGYLQGGDYEVNEVHVGTASREPSLPCI